MSARSQRAGALLKPWLAFLVAALVIVAAAAPATAQLKGLDVVSEATFAPAPDEGLVRVSATFVITNEKPNAADRGGTVRYYYDRFPLVLPSSTTGVAAVVNGTTANVTVEPYEDDPSAVIATVRLPRRIWLGESATINLSYVLEGGPPRDPGVWVRVNSAYVAFPVWVCCDAGQASLRIEMPGEFDVDFSGSDGLVESSLEPGVWLVQDIESPIDFFVMTFGRSDDGLVHETVMVGITEATLSAWPDDQEWLDFTRSQVVGGLPVLEELTGIPAGIPDLQLVETTTPYLYGYAGWFNTRTNVVEVGEDLDAQVILHELSHIWFNQSLFGERWMNEGFAEVFSNAALQGSARDGEQPTPPDLTSPYAVALRDWDVPRGLTDEERAASEAFGYNASWFVVDALADEVGLEGLAEVMRAVDTGELSYAASDERPIERYRGDIDDWRRLLDLVEQRAGSVLAESLLRPYVLTDADVDLLDERARALGLWKQMVAESGSWETPIGVRMSLTDWDFRFVAPFADLNTEVLTRRDEVIAAAAALSVAVPGNVELAYEQAERPEHVGDVLGSLRGQLAALATVADAETAARGDYGFWTTWGLRDTDLEAEYAEVRAAFEQSDFLALEGEAQQIDFLVADAAGKAQKFFVRLGIAVISIGVALALVIWAVRRWLRRRRQRRLSASVNGDVTTDYYGADHEFGDIASNSEPVPRAPALADQRAAAGEGHPQHSPHEDELSPPR
jgi:hypothetical protein